MKRNIAIAILLQILMNPVLWAQNSQERVIEVIGSHEMPVEPNEIYLNIVLKEYKKDKEIVSIEKMEQEFLTILKAQQIDIKNLSINKIIGFQQKVKRNTEEFLVSKSYTLKLDSLLKLNRLLDELENINIESVKIAKTSHTEIEKYKLQAQQAAVKVAKIKAITMLGELNEQLGKVLVVKEIMTDILSIFETTPTLYEERGKLYVGRFTSFDGGNNIKADVFRIYCQVSVKFEIKQ